MASANVFLALATASWVMSPKTVQVTWRGCLLAIENAAVLVCCFVLRGRVIVFGSMSPQGDIDIFIVMSLIKHMLVAGLPKLSPPPPPTVSLLRVSGNYNPDGTATGRGGGPP